MPANARLSTQAPQSHGTGTVDGTPVNRPVASGQRGDDASTNTMLTPVSHGTRTSDNAPGNLPATPQSRTEGARNTTQNLPTAPNHDNQVAGGSDFSVNASASATPNVVPRKIGFTFLGTQTRTLPPGANNPAPSSLPRHASSLTPMSKCFTA